MYAPVKCTFIQYIQLHTLLHWNGEKISMQFIKPQFWFNSQDIQIGSDFKHTKVNKIIYKYHSSKLSHSFVYVFKGI